MSDYSGCFVPHIVLMIQSHTVADVMSYKVKGVTYCSSLGLCSNTVNAYFPIIDYISITIKTTPSVSVFRFCGGLLLDIKRKAPFFVSDFTDAFHIQALSAILFIYLGTVTNAITFGGLLGDATENMQVRLRVCGLMTIYVPNDSLTEPSVCAGCVGEFSGHSDHRRGFLPAGWTASHHPQQHRACTGV